MGSIQNRTTDPTVVEVLEGKFMRRNSARKLTGRIALWLAPVLLVPVLLVAVSLDAQAQLPRTKLYSLFPPGGKSGVTVDVKIANGADLDEIDRLHFNHPGIKAVQKTQESAGKQVPVTNTFVVTIAANVPPGLYEARAAGLYGASNPRTFVVGTSEEIAETEANDTLDKATEITIGQVVNATSGKATDVDYYKFQGKKGQRIIATAQARRIDSKMFAVLEFYDAMGRKLGYGRDNILHDPLLDVTIPADGEYYVKVFDFVYAGGVDYVYRLSLSTNPHIDYVLPPAGLAGAPNQFTLYGRNLPGGQPAGVSINGRPLEKLAVQIALPKDGTIQNTVDHLGPSAAGVDAISYTLDSPAGKSNPVLIQLATTKPTVEQEPNDTPATAQKVTLPAEFGGQFQQRGDIDVITFDAKAGEIYYIEVIGQRIGTSADPYFVLEQIGKDAKGVETVKRIVAQDDYVVKADNNRPNPAGAMFSLSTDDPLYRFVVPADGNYRLQIRDRYFESRGNPTLVYRVSIRHEAPDFRLVALPVGFKVNGNNRAAETGSLALQRGENLSAVIMAVRRDGFNGTIDISVDGLPAGVTCKGAAIGPGSQTAELVFTAADNAAKWFGPIKITGKARIQDPVKFRAIASTKTAATKATAALPKLVEAVTKANGVLTKANADFAKAKKKSDDATAKVTAAKAAQVKTDATSKDTIAKAKVADTAKNAADKAVADADKAAKDTAAKSNAAKSAAAKDKENKGLAKVAVDTATAATQAATKLTAAKAAQVKTAAAAKDTIAKAKVADTAKKAADKVVVDADKAAKAAVVQATAAQVAVTKTLADAKKATDAKTAADKQIADAQAAVKTAETELAASSRDVVRPARAATIAWIGVANTTPTISRMAKSICLSVSSEQAPFQVSTDVGHVEVNQGRQILIPVKLVKRNKFDNIVKLTFTGLPKNSNVTVANSQIAKGKDTVLLRMFVNNNALPGKYTVFLASQATVSYSRNPQRIARAKAAQAEVTNQVKPTADAAKAAAAEKTKADKAVADADKAVKAADAKAKTAKAAADKAKDNAGLAKAATDAAAAATKAAATLKIAKAAQTKADTASKAAAAKAKAVADAKKVADKAVTDATNAAKPKNLNLTLPSTPIVLTVKKGPGTITAAVPGGGKLKKGQKLDVKVTLKRANGFQGPVTLTFPTIPGVTGITAAPVTIAADATEGVLSIQSAGNATEGKLANLVIRGTMDFEGKAAVDVAVALTVSK
jgi:hypothetical protein